MLAIELADHRYVHHLMCYGGTFGITPAFAADYFGARHVGATFGFMMLVWAFPAGFGPLLFAWIRETRRRFI